jgi:hypothetical protein
MQAVMPLRTKNGGSPSTLGNAALTQGIRAASTNPVRRVHGAVVRILHGHRAPPLDQEPSMKTLIRAAEIWVPDADGYLLEFGGGVYGNAPAFGAVSRTMCFGRGEGLPGRVWEEGIPIILKELQAGYFQRAAAAKAAELTCAVAFPMFFGDLLKAVVVLFCGDVDGQSGAIEVWHNDPRITSDLTLLDGVYGTQDASFEAASRDTFLPRGMGLPGAAWQKQGSVFMDGLSASTKFVRAQEAAATRIRRGLAMPCPVPTNDSYVLAFLSAPEMPIATRIESWVSGADAQALKRAHGFDEVAGALAVEERSSAEVDPTIFATFAGGVPKAGPGSLIALPIVSDEVVVETIAMYF